MSNKFEQRIEALELKRGELCNYKPCFDFDRLSTELLLRFKQAYESGEPISPEDEATFESVRIRPD